MIAKALLVVGVGISVMPTAWRQRAEAWISKSAYAHAVLLAVVTAFLLAFSIIYLQSSSEGFIYASF